MNIDEFWRLIEKTRIESKGDTETQEQLLEDRLFKMSVEDIVTFQGIFEEYDGYADKDYLWDAVIMMRGFCSNDGFTDFRAWLIAQGRQIYNSTIKDPDTLADYVDVTKVWETFAAPGFVANRAYQRKTNSADDGWMPTPSSKIEITFDVEPSDKGCIFIDKVHPKEETIEECLKTHYPKLWAKFCEE